MLKKRPIPSSSQSYSLVESQARAQRARGRPGAGMLSCNLPCSSLRRYMYCTSAREELEIITSQKRLASDFQCSVDHLTSVDEETQTRKRHTRLGCSRDVHLIMSKRSFLKQSTSSWSVWLLFGAVFGQKFSAWWVLRIGGSFPLWIHVFPSDSGQFGRIQLVGNTSSYFCFFAKGDIETLSSTLDISASVHAFPPSLPCNLGPKTVHFWAPTFKWVRIERKIVGFPVEYVCGLFIMTILCYSDCIVWFASSCDHILSCSLQKTGPKRCKKILWLFEKLEGRVMPSGFLLKEPPNHKILSHSLKKSIRW